MQYTTLGKTGLVVSRLMLGTMTFGEGTSYGFDHPVNQERANNMVSQALEAGINFFDTANNYGEGRAEEYLGRALGSQRSNVIIATKLGARTGPALTDAGLSYRHVIASTEASLKRLGTDYIDLLQLHVPDPLTPFVSAQMYYSLLGRDIEYGVVPFLRYEGLGLLVWSPLAGGFLSGKYSRELTSESSGRLASFDYLSILSIDREKGYTVIERLREIAAVHGEATPAQIALAWLLTKPVVSSVILGASTPEQFADNINASNLRLSPEEVASLDMLTEPKPLYPYRWRASGGDSVVRQALNIS